MNRAGRGFLVTNLVTRSGLDTSATADYSTAGKKESADRSGEFNDLEADVISLLSNQSDVALTPDGIRRLAATEGDPEPPAEPSVFKHHRLETRLGADGVAVVVSRYEAGESANTIAKDIGVAPSALVRLLRNQNVVIRKRIVTNDETQQLAREYKAGATMAELEQKHQLSHGAVFRALRRAGVETRPSAPRRHEQPDSANADLVLPCGRTQGSRFQP